MVNIKHLMSRETLDSLFEQLPALNEDGIEDIRKEPIFMKFSLANLSWYILQGDKMNINGELDIQFFGYFVNCFTGEYELSYFHLSDLHSVYAWFDPDFYGCIADVL